MSKRRVNKQQSARIQKIQANYLSSAEITNESCLTGLVLTRFSRHAEIEDNSGNRIHCSIRPNIDSLVAGDRIIWQPEGTGQGVVLSRFPRDSMLGRPDKRGDFKPIAANITQIMVVVAAKPELSWPLLDSYLVMAESLKLKICIVLNKVDLACKSIRTDLEAFYEPLGYTLLFTCQNDSESYLRLQEALNHHISVFVGQSGVGKSSLIAGILPHEANIQTAEISLISELGCHTTRNSRLYHLPNGGALIDSPGVRELGLWHMPLNEIVDGYRELKHYSKNCKFRNCNHHDTPGCAIISALESGQIPLKRYDNFLKITTQFLK
ncbi:ribosome small subunit-dependent GTPase A [Legionella hackeliae]|uniref:Small ribosomal subunit biogenesis GTPase RsgA n=1 Tax=Legionella hackeliae TaxID=449 RepID=A0A0A8UW70_LEGHA|nr:ribosome small subunit-dependent GTPase A [Legionella hackeliae]KTD09918.1 EngC GTPase [Legionella hackeliae]CEK11781.1 ribosome small subunit-dependent GTPase A [Legionella hackeliae]STX48552.1 EngC GTPase [Legionella hackeliae]